MRLTIIVILLFGFCNGQGMSLGVAGGGGMQLQLGSLRPQGPALEVLERFDAKKISGTTWQAGINLNILLPGNWWLQPEFFYTEARDVFEFYTLQRTNVGQVLDQTHRQVNRYFYSEFAVLFKWRPYWMSKVVPYYLFGPYVEQGSGFAQPRIEHHSGPQGAGFYQYPEWVNDNQRPTRLGGIVAAGLQYKTRKSRISVNLEVRAQMSVLTSFRDDDGVHILMVPHLEQELGGDAIKQNMRPFKLMTIMGLNYHFDCY